MKNKLLVMLAAAMFLALPMTALAKISGDCADCHTMHNSKAGAPMAQLSDGSGPSTTPFPVLLISDCVGCHASGGADAIADFNGSQVPQVYHTGDDLAGGNFAYIDGAKGAGADDRKGHNVVDILSADATLTGPPGMGRGAVMSINDGGSMHTGSVAVPAASFTCAGNDGCHGVRNRLAVAANVDLNITAVKLQGLAAMTGAHHYNVDGKIDGAGAATALDPASSYRFLNGAYGNEDADWQATVSASDHNDYFGTNGSSVAASGCGQCHAVGTGSSLTALMTTPGHSISGYCSTCHGTFHADTLNGSFVRHPTDYALPNKTEYQAYTVYDPNAPVARTDLSLADNSLVTPGGGTDVVACLSCHVAHASDNAGMLRFDYASMVAGGGDNTTGCFVCHTTKDTGTKEGLIWTATDAGNM